MSDNGQINKPREEWRPSMLPLNHQVLSYVEHRRHDPEPGNRIDAPQAGILAAILGIRRMQCRPDSIDD
jgi:hypothetical protein